MNIQDKINTIKNQLTSLRTVSKDIIDASETIEGRKEIMDIVDRAFSSAWDSLYRFQCAIQAIYKKFDPTFTFPKFKDNTYNLEWLYTEEHGYILLKIDTSSSIEYNLVSFVGFSSLFYSYQENTEEHTLESTYNFIMSCVQYISKATRKTLCLPIFEPNEVVFLSLFCHYYFDYRIDEHPNLNYIESTRGGIYDDFKRMVFETNGAHPLSVRGSLPIMSHYARKKAAGHYVWADSDPSSFVKDMRSNKALNLREAFNRMESYLNYDFSDEGEKKITFICNVGVSTDAPHYDRRKRLTGVSVKPVSFFSDSLKLGIFSTCMPGDSSSFDEQYIGWIDFNGSTTVFDRYEDVFNCLEDNIVNTLEDNYNFLVEKLPELDKERLRNDMLDYITTEGS